MPYRVPDPLPLPPPPPPGPPRAWWLHVALVAAPVLAAASLRRADAQIDVAVAWLLYCTVSSAALVRRRGEVDAWVLAHVALVLLGLGVLGAVVRPLV